MSTFTTTNPFAALESSALNLSPESHEDASDDGNDSDSSSQASSSESNSGDGEEEDWETRYERKRKVQDAKEKATLESLVSEEQFQEGRGRRFGASNPEVMDVHFWNVMVRTGYDPYTVRKALVYGKSGSNEKELDLRSVEDALLASVQQTIKPGEDGKADEKVEDSKEAAAEDRTGETNKTDEKSDHTEEVAAEDRTEKGEETDEKVDLTNEAAAAFWSNPIWTGPRQRIAGSSTKLPDGTFVQIGGEHEDFYDPDFLIYNDVIVWHPDGEFDRRPRGLPVRGSTNFTIYGYPKDVFPPTDNHTATYVPSQNAIFVIGNLGDDSDRKRRGVEYTSVFRLQVGTWKMERVETTGEGPGAIWQHKAELKGDKIWVKSNGALPDEYGDHQCTKREVMKDGKEETVNVLTEAWSLDSGSLEWRAHKLAVSNKTV